MKKEDILKNTTILFDDLAKWSPRMCIVKGQQSNSLYVLEDSRSLENQEILRIFFGLAKYLQAHEIISITGKEEILSFSFNSKESNADEKKNNTTGFRNVAEAN